MRRFLALGALLLLIGCSVALAQSAVAPPLAVGIPWEQVVAAFGALTAALGALIKVGHDLVAKLNRAIGAVDARAAAFEKVVADGFTAGIGRLDRFESRMDRIETETRRGSDAAIHTSGRLDSIDHHIDRIREKIGDDPTGEVPRPTGTR